MLHENRGEEEPDIDFLLDRMADVDLVLIEGFKSYPHPKLEVYRPEVGKPILCTDDASIVAIATNTEIETKIPHLRIDDIEAISDFVMTYCGFSSERRHGTA